MTPLRRLRRWLYGDRPQVEGSPVVPKEVREASHELANRAHEVQAQLKRLQRTEDPFYAFAKAMRGQENGKHR